VNSVGTHLDMSRGALSNAILSAAGQGIQNELWTVVGNSYGQPGCVYVTKGHRLNCKHVLHAVGYSTERGSGHSVQVGSNMFHLNTDRTAFLEISR